MPRPYHLALTSEQTQELQQTRDHARLPYLRERAAVLLAVTTGHSLRQAARTAGLKPHTVDTVCAWVHRYQSAGLSGLLIHQGRGRKPASFPRAVPHGAGDAATSGGPTP